MRKVFTYLELCANRLKLYFNKMFIPFKKLLFEAVDKMIEDDRNFKVVDRTKIKNLLRVNFIF